MTALRTWLQSVHDWPHWRDCLDVIYPTAAPLAPDNAERVAKRLQDHIAAIPTDPKLLAESTEAIEALLKNEMARRQGVEARLTSIMGLSSIAGAIIFGFLIGTSGASYIQNRSLRIVMTLGAFYLAAQVCRAMYMALQGLSRKSYYSLDPLDVCARPEETNLAYKTRRAKELLEVLSDHQVVNNGKVTQMAVAHCAMRNFLWGLLIFAAVSSVAAIASKPNDALLKNLKKDGELIEMLRGPRGPQGVPGPEGKQGPQGPPRPSRTPAKALSN